MRRRVCRYCNVEKDFSDFVTSQSGRFGITWRCKMCLRLKSGLPAIASPRKPSKWITIKRIGVKGYNGAAVYKLSFDDGSLFYIGSTIKAINKVSRWQKNFREGKINKRMKDLIQNKSFATFEILERVEDISKLFEREEWYISQYKNNPAMLNRSLSAKGAMIPVFDGDSWGENQTDKKPVNQYRNGVFIATHESISDAAKTIGTTSSKIWHCCYGSAKSIYGFTFSFVNEADKIIKHSGKPHPSRKKTYCFDMDGNLLNEYASMSEAAKEMNIPRPQIANVISGRSHMVNGYIFSLTTTPPNAKQNIAENKKATDLRRRIKTGKRIIQYSKNGDFVNEYLCIKEAAEVLSIPWKSIRKVANGERKSTHDFIFRRSEAVV